MPLIPELGVTAALAGWYRPRIVAGSRLRLSPTLLLDLLIPLFGFVLLCALTARPLFAGVMILALGAGYGYADRAKRSVLAEPIVFTDIFQAIDIARHPKLALPFPHLQRVYLGVAAVLAFFATLFAWEPQAWRWSPWEPLTGVAALAVGIALLLIPGRNMLGGLLRRLQPQGDAARDSADFGPLATLLIHGLIARAERDQRRVPPTQLPRSLRAASSAAPPVVLVQCESFFDARRLHSGVPAGLLPNFDRLRGTALQCGKLGVPSWGANTVRTEFEVLSGLTQAQIGMDWFDPYHRFADARVASLAWRLRSEGYRTICLHPFDRHFYRRDRVMQQLGFEVYLGEEAFAGAQRRNGYITDVEVARTAASILDEEGERTFLFAITMENHGPWSCPPPGTPDPLAALRLPPAEAAGFACYLEGLRSSDAMLGLLAARLAAAPTPGLLAFYGDHLPGFTATYKALGFGERATDYLIWQAGAVLGAARELDLPAHGLGQQIWRALLNKPPLAARETADPRWVAR